jgi:hypothetical protein
MLMRETASRMLPVGGLAILGLAMLFLPPMVGRAQSQPAAERTDLRERLQALEKAQQDIRHMQEELDRARQNLERQTQDLNRKMEQVQKAAREAASSALPVQRKSSAPKGVQVGQGPAPMAGPAANPPVAMGAAGNMGGDLEKRLREVERKLDLLLQMMRRPQPGGLVPPGAGNANPFLEPPPPTVAPGRRFSQQPSTAPLAPTPAASPRFEAQPIQPVPPAPPRPELPQPEDLNAPIGL